MNSIIKYILVTLMLVSLTACTGSVIQEQNKQLKIGFIGPLSGDASPWGIPPKEGIELASIGKNVQTIYEDDQCNPQQAVTAVNKLISTDKVDAIIGAVCSSATLAIAPIIEQNHILLISPASTNPQVTNAGDFIFRIVPSDSLRAEVFAKYLNARGIHSIAFLYVNSVSGQGAKDAFKDTFTNLGGTITNEQSYSEQAKDFRTQLLKLKESKPDALVIVSFVQETNNILDQMVELDITIPKYFLTEAMDDPSVAKNPSAKNIPYILAASITSVNAEDFISTYKNYFNKNPTVYAAEGYDAFNLMYDSYNSCVNDADVHVCMRDHLYKIKDYQGASGTITFDINGDVIKPMAIKTIKNGKPEVVEII